MKNQLTTKGTKEHKGKTRNFSFVYFVSFVVEDFSSVVMEKQR